MFEFSIGKVYQISTLYRRCYTQGAPQIVEIDTTRSSRPYSW